MLFQKASFLLGMFSYTDLKIYFPYLVHILWIKNGMLSRLFPSGLYTILMLFKSSVPTGAGTDGLYAGADTVARFFSSCRAQGTVIVVSAFN
jgi:hypothetical protein